MSYTVPVPWHLLVHTAQYIAPQFTTDNGFPVHGNDSPQLPAYPCNVQEDSSSTGMANSRLVGTRSATLLIPFEYNGSAITLEKDGEVVIEGQGFPVARRFRITGISRNVAGANCLQAFDIVEDS